MGPVWAPLWTPPKGANHHFNIRPYVARTRDWLMFVVKCFIISMYLQFQRCFHNINVSTISIYLQYQCIYNINVSTIQGVVRCFHNINVSTMSFSS